MHRRSKDGEDNEAEAGEIERWETEAKGGAVDQASKKRWCDCFTRSCGLLLSPGEHQPLLW
jgi:hypothetical protein